jgi:hypothetical protein
MVTTAVVIAQMNAMTASTVPVEEKEETAIDSAAVPEVGSRIL